jgi:hypothetical protein
MIRKAFPLSIALLLAVAGAAGAQQNAELEAGIRAYAVEGDAREAIRRIGNALDAGSVPTAGRPRAHVYIAHAFLSLGDTVSAMPHIERALATQPCLLPSADISRPEWLALYEQSRPRGISCDRRAMSATLQSMLVPGLGQRALGRRTASNSFFLSTVLAAGGAFLQLERGDSRYAAYQASTSYPEVVSLYDQAQTARRVGTVLASAAVGLYLWNVVDAAVGGMAHDRELARVRPLAVTPVLAPNPSGGAGIALQIPLR